MRLQGVLDSHSLVNGQELARAFEGYLHYMLKIFDWDGAFLDGIFKVNEAVQALSNSDKKPSEIVAEVYKAFKGETIVDTLRSVLTPEEITERYKLIRALSLHFHPDSPNVRDLPPMEVERRNEIFKIYISPAIKESDSRGLAMLRQIAREQNIQI